MLCLCKFSESNGTFLYTRISIQRYWDCLLPSAYLESLLFKICKCVCTATTSRSLCLHYEYQNNKCKIQKILIILLMYTKILYIMCTTIMVLGIGMDGISSKTNKKYLNIYLL